MPRLFISTAVLAFWLTLPLSGHAQSQVTVGGGADIGQREYSYSCAVCHGKAGKGDGPLTEFLKKKPTNLTTVQKDNGGVFPFDRLYAAIDGREAVAAHGPREMPVWGLQFRLDGTELRGFPLTPENAESFVRGRIIALVGYIYTLQAK